MPPFDGSVDPWSLATTWIDYVLDRLGIDPFAYLVVTIVGVAVWIWYSVISEFALTGRDLWIRRLSLIVAGLGAVLFTYGAMRLH
jgi:hypothetical protein